MVGFIRVHVNPYFELFSDPERVFTLLKDGELSHSTDTSTPGLYLSSTVEYLLCFGNVGAAKSFLDRHVALNDGISNEIDVELARFEAGEKFMFGDGNASEIARLKFTHNL